MATYITLLNFTDQGIRNFKETPKRANAFVESAKKLGVEIEKIYWTVGAHDGVVIFDAPDDETAAATLLSLAALGNVRTQSLRAFGRSEIEAIVAKAP